MNPIQIRESKLEELAQNNRSWLLGLGAVIVALGLLALVLAVASTLLSVFLIGVVALGAGLVQVVYAFSARHWPGFFFHLALAAVYAFAGIYLMASPVISALLLTLLLAFTLLAGGFLRVIVAGFQRFPGWGWSMASGLVTVLLGGFILYLWPAASLWTLGAFLGLDLIFLGLFLMAAAWSLGREERTQVNGLRTGSMG